MEKDQALKDIETIKSFIHEGRMRLSDSGQFFIFWGAVMPLATAGNFLLIHLELFDLIKWYWPICMTLCSAVSLWMGFQKSKKEKKKSFVTEINKMLWLGLLISFAVLLTLVYLTGAIFSSITLCFVAITMGLSLWIHGSMLRLTWVRWISLGWWTSAIIMAVLPLSKASMVMAITTFLLSFIPGIILRKGNRKD